MKYIHNYFFPMLLLPMLLLSSCEDNKLYLPDNVKSTVYLIQASENPRTTSLFMLEDEIQTAVYSAFYSGLSAPKDIRLTFEVDMSLVDAYNEDNLTEYRAMPAGSYELGTTSATIPAGESRSGVMKLNFLTYGYIEAFVNYMLPLVMKSDDAKVNEELSVIYYNITASYAPGNIPRREVYPDIPDFRFVSYQDKCLLTLNSAGDVLRYTYNNDTGAFNAPTTAQTGWQSITHIAPGGANTIQAMDPAFTNGSVVTYQSNGDGSVIPQYGEREPSPIFTNLSGGYQPIGNGKHDGLIMLQMNNGNINYYGLNNTWTGYVGPQVPTKYDFGKYKIIFFYDRDLIGIDNAGDMWLHTYNPDTRYFSTTPSQIGSGWEDYTRITAYGTDLLARDADGVLWLYEFDLRGFWALKTLS